MTYKTSDLGLHSVHGPDHGTDGFLVFTQDMSHVGDILPYILLLYMCSLKYNTPIVNVLD